MFPGFAAIADSLELRDNVIASLENGLVVGKVSFVHKSSYFKRSIENHTVPVDLGGKTSVVLNRGSKIADVPYKEIQVTPEPSQLNMGCNREFLEFLSGQLGKTEDVIIAIFPSFAAGSRSIGDDGDWLASSPDAADKEIDVFL